MNGKRLISVLAFTIQFLAACLPGFSKDLVVLYDQSGSIKWRQGWQNAFTSANEVIRNLILDGKLPPEGQWQIEKAPVFDQEVIGALVGPGDHLIFMLFSQPHQCFPPFFPVKSQQIQTISDVSLLLGTYLPKSDQIKPIDAWTFLDLAKWQALHELELASTSNEWFFIYLSDFDRDMGGKCAGDPEVSRKIQQARTQWISEPLVSMVWRTSEDRVELISIELSRVKVNAPVIDSRKAPQEEVDPESPPSQDDEILLERDGLTWLDFIVILLICIGLVFLFRWFVTHRGRRSRMEE